MFPLSYFPSIMAFVWLLRKFRLCAYASSWGSLQPVCEVHLCTILCAGRVICASSHPLHGNSLNLGSPCIVPAPEMEVFRNSDLAWGRGKLGEDHSPTTAHLHVCPRSPNTLHTHARPCWLTIIFPTVTTPNPSTHFKISNSTLPPKPPVSNWTSLVKETQFSHVKLPKIFFTL